MSIKGHFMHVLNLGIKLSENPNLKEDFESLKKLVDIQTEEELKKLFGSTVKKKWQRSFYGVRE